MSDINGDTWLSQSGHEEKRGWETIQIYRWNNKILQGNASASDKFPHIYRQNETRFDDN